jgi:ATP-dependent helicase/nuclease subunit A
MAVKIISAGAGSGKTYRLTQEMVKLLREGTRASGIIATTFTSKAAAELQERVRTKLLEEGLTEQANDLSNALIGTVHGLGVKLLKRFAFEAGVSPQVDIIADEDQQIMFNQSLAQILTYERVENMNVLCEKLGLTKKTGTYDWRKDVRQLVDVARANAFSKDILEESKKRSFSTFQAFLGEPYTSEVAYNDKLQELLNQSIDALTGGADETKVTQEALNDLRMLRNELRQRESLQWHQWVKIGKLKVGAKSREAVQELLDFSKIHTQFPAFQDTIKSFIDNIFDIVIGGIAEYDRFKKQRGLIDYTDMEVLVRQLLANPSVLEVLHDELDLLMVDEFQDTSPIQLDIFLKLSHIAKNSIWVGDPKQSIYGFRGAEPRLMEAIIKHIGIKDEDILKDSWRSRPDIVNATNAIFTKAFKNLPTEQVALTPKRKDANIQTDALIHWQFAFDNGGDTRKRQPAAPWTENCVAESLRIFLERQPMILPKGEKECRPAQAGDVAILCRTNDQCKTVAEALHRVGLKAAIARTGLLETAEAKLIFAVLRYLLNKHDSLSVAEILLLAEQKHLAEIIEHRLDFLAKVGEDKYDWKWAYDNDFIKQINDLRRDILELSSNETLNFILEELDLRRIIVSWGNATQRLDNVDVIRKLSIQYEENCNRLHMAASLGGFLLWLGNLQERGDDTQSSGEGVDAVNVLTYHRSKGLEYPILILGNLENNLKDQVFGVAIQPLTKSDTEGVDLNDILGNRWLRFWVNPYADLFKNTELEERINSSEAKAEVKLAALAEEARLLYVGITRARDYLIFPTTQSPTKWLNRTWHHGNEDFPTLETGNETHFLWQAKYLSKDFEEFVYEKDFGYAPLSIEKIQFIEERKGKYSFLSYKIDVEKENMVHESRIQLGQIEEYAPAIALKEGAQPPRVAQALNSYLTAMPETERLVSAKSLVDRYDVAEMTVYQQFVRNGDAFKMYLNTLFKIKNQLNRYPVRAHFNGRLVDIGVDFYLYTEGGHILILNNDFSSDSKKIKSEATRMATKVSWIKKAFLATLDNKNKVKIETYIHFPLLGSLIKIEI